MKPSTKTKIAISIAKSTSDVFLRSEFDRFGTASRVTRAIQELIAEGRLIRLGYGVYAKAKPSSISGNAVTRLPLESLAESALEALGVPSTLGTAREDYSQAKTTQIPMACVIGVGTSRIQRKLALAGRAVIYEKNKA